MTKLRCSITTSLDGFVAGPNQSLDHPLGEGGMALHQWAFPTRTFRSMHGDGGGGETGVNDDIFGEAFENVGATIMGRNMFGPVRGPWGQDPWKGWWDDEPPFHHPVFVLTHHGRPPLPMRGGTTFHFVTEGIESALAQARTAAGGKDITIGGGASTVQQYLAAGLLDELDLHVVPCLLGAGARLLDRLDVNKVKLELIRTIAGPGVAHLKYRRGR
ncbi:MAG TPA: dihydrofolate reductase family protein [Opitutaceae bacterium]|nr:dihydrofolate reductase family protein [Opitutaceae bacterium]